MRSKGPEVEGKESDELQVTTSDSHVAKRKKFVNVVVTVSPVKYQKFAACRLEGRPGPGNTECLAMCTFRGYQT